MRWDNYGWHSNHTMTDTAIQMLLRAARETVDRRIKALQMRPDPKPTRYDISVDRCRLFTENSIISVFCYTSGGGSRVAHKPRPGGEYDETNPKVYYTLEHLEDLEPITPQADACPW